MNGLVFDIIAAHSSGTFTPSHDSTLTEHIEELRHCDGQAFAELGPVAGPGSSGPAVSTAPAAVSTLASGRSEEDKAWTYTRPEFNVETLAAAEAPAAAEAAAIPSFLDHLASLKAKEARAERETQDATLASLAAEPPEAETAKKLAAADEATDAFFRDLFLSHSAAEREEHARRLESEPDARWIDAAFMR